MRYRFEFFNPEERREIIENNLDKHLTEEHNINEGNFLIFTDEKPLSEEVKEIRLEMARGNSELFETMLKLTGGGV